MSKGAKKPALPCKATDHYSNILLLAPDDQPLATIPAKRARWYKKRDLVECLPNKEGFTEVLRLLVEPAGRPSKHIEPLVNQCVVCGSTEELSCHHVIPKAVRAHFKPSEKEHASNWCVLVCEAHHLAAEKLARSLYEKPLQEATGKAHQHHSELCNEIIRQTLKTGGDPATLDLSGFHVDRRDAVKQAQKACAEKLIESYGGFEGAKDLFRRKFLELNPLFVPRGFLTDDWQK